LGRFKTVDQIREPFPIILQKRTKETKRGEFRGGARRPGAPWAASEARRVEISEIANYSSPRLKFESSRTQTVAPGPPVAEAVAHRVAPHLI